MSWTVQGTYYENCSCDAVCPCTWSNMAQPATNDDCRVALLFEVEAGDVEGVDVAGTSCVIIMQTPRQMLEGGFKVGLIIDDGATDEQAGALGKVFGGQAGGPVAALGPLIGEFMGVERLPVNVAHDGAAHHITVGDALDIDLAMVQTETGDPVELTNIVVHPAGPTLNVAVAERVNNSVFGIEWSGERLSAFSNPFSWAA